MIPTVVISSRGAQRVESGHPWVYRADLVDSQAQAGDRVIVRGPRGRTLGQALYSDRSQIAIRMLTRGDAAADDELLRRRIETAIAFRRSLAIDASNGASPRASIRSGICDRSLNSACPSVRRRGPMTSTMSPPEASTSATSAR